MSIGLGIAGIVLSMFDRLNNHYSTSYDGKTKLVTISQPDLGPKSLDINSDEIDNFVGVLAAFDPEVELSQAETVRRTLELVTVKGEEVYRFKTSTASGSRAVVIPKDDWSDFVKWWTMAADSVEDTIAKYQAMNAETDDE
jgi:hypothetical protein